MQALNDQLKAAREDPQNFNQWVSLVTAAEKVVSCELPLPGRHLTRMKAACY